MARNKIFCSIVILNYFGEKLITQVIESLKKQTFPKDRFEIIIVDNNSQDNSREILTELSKNYPLRLKFLPKNFGFSKGNNVGIKMAKGKYVCLLNNDCVVEPNWLLELVKGALKEKKTFAVCSKVILYQKYLSINLHVDKAIVPLYAWIAESNLYQFQKNKKKLFLPLWENPGGYKIEVLFDPRVDQSLKVSIVFTNREKIPKDLKKLKELIISRDKFARVVDVTVSNLDIEFKIEIDLKNQRIQEKALNKIQNAGTMVFQDGYGRDIGSIVRYFQQFYEYDMGQFDEYREVYAVCGAAVLLNKKILERCGYLDESYFMYYEDVDVCEKARFLGYKTYYQPKAVARHLHAFSSTEWSPFFIYHVEKGRLMHVFYNFPFRVFLKEYFGMVLKSAFSLASILVELRVFIYNMKNRKKGEEPKFAKRIQIIKVILFYTFSLWYLMLIKIKREIGRRPGEVEKNYQRILKGDWYLL